MNELLENIYDNTFDYETNKPTKDNYFMLISFFICEYVRNILCFTAAPFKTDCDSHHAKKSFAEKFISVIRPERNERRRVKNK